MYTRAKALRVTPSEYTGHVVTMEDIIERKRAKAELTQAQEVALESASLRSDFLAHMSHDPHALNAVLGMTELLLDTDLISKQREFSRTVRDSAEVLLVIFNDILDFSKTDLVMQDASISGSLYKPVKGAKLFDRLTRIIREVFTPPAGGTTPCNTGINRPSLAMVHGPLRILLVGDNPIQQKLVLLQLGRRGYRADVAVTGSEVLRNSAQTPYDVILMDCHMPRNRR